MNQYTRIATLHKTNNVRLEIFRNPPFSGHIYTIQFYTWSTWEKLWRCVGVDYANTLEDILR
jgi:hypothetical protein